MWWVGGTRISWRPHRSNFRNLHLFPTGSFSGMPIRSSSSAWRSTPLPLYGYLSSRLSFFPSSYLLSLSCFHLFAFHILTLRNPFSYTQHAMAMPAQPRASSASQQQPRKSTALERNKLEWETHKNEIEEIYMDQDKTLEETMLFFKEKRGLDWR